MHRDSEMQREGAELIRLDRAVWMMLRALTTTAKPFSSRDRRRAIALAWHLGIAFMRQPSFIFSA